jgi:hypothetical protein
MRYSVESVARRRRRRRLDWSASWLAGGHRGPAAGGKNRRPGPVLLLRAHGGRLSGDRGGAGVPAGVPKRHDRGGGNGRYRDSVFQPRGPARNSCHHGEPDRALGDLRNSEVFDRTVFTRDDQVLEQFNAGINAGQHEGGGNGGLTKVPRRHREYGVGHEVRHAIHIHAMVFGPVERIPTLRRASRPERPRRAGFTRRRAIR